MPEQVIRTFLVMWNHAYITVCIVNWDNKEYTFKQMSNKILKNQIKILDMNKHLQNHRYVVERMSHWKIKDYFVLTRSRKKLGSLFYVWWVILFQSDVFLVHIWICQLGLIKKTRVLLFDWYYWAMLFW